ncbi:MAG: hypothetical protein ACI4Q6_01165 [Huintestinicola sp.]
MRFMNENVKTNSELNDSELEMVSGGTDESAGCGSEYKVHDIVKISYIGDRSLRKLYEEVSILEVIDKGDGSYRYAVRTAKAGRMIAPSRFCQILGRA